MFPSVCGLTVDIRCGDRLRQGEPKIESHHIPVLFGLGKLTDTDIQAIIPEELNYMKLKKYQAPILSKMAP